jgi:hypothetical protein
MSFLLLFQNYVINPVRCMNVWLGSVKPSWDRYVTRLTIITLPFLHDQCLVRTCPRLSLLAVMIDLKPCLVPQFFSNLKHCHKDLWQSDWFSFINTIHINITLSSITHDKEQACSYFRLSLGPLAA